VSDSELARLRLRRRVGLDAIGGPAPRVHMHTTKDLCELTNCDWSGFHFHWRGERYRTAFPATGRTPALDPELLDAFDADCAADRSDRAKDR